MKVRIKNKITFDLYTVIFLLSFVVMLYFFLPITASFLTAIMMLGILVLLYIIIFACSNWRKREVVISNLLIFLTMCIIFVAREYYKDGLIGLYSILLCFYPIFLSIFLINKSMFQFMKKLAISIMIMMLITGITSFVGLSIYPELARDLAAFNSDNIIRISTMYNVGGYDFTYCVVISIPVYCLLAEKKLSLLTKRIIEILFAVVSIIFVVKTQYTTALLLAIVSYGMIIIIRKFDLKRLCIIAVLGFLILSGIKGEIANGLSNMAMNIESHSISQRLNELSKTLEGKSVTGEDITARGNAYGKSIDAFVEHPILGTWVISDNMKKLGGHSTILDLMAGIGIIAFLFIIYTFYHVEKKMLCNFKDDITKKYIGIFLVIYLMLACINPIISGTFFTVLFIVLPGVTMIENR